VLPSAAGFAFQAPVDAVDLAENSEEETTDEDDGAYDSNMHYSSHAHTLQARGIVKRHSTTRKPRGQLSDFEQVRTYTQEKLVRYSPSSESCCFKMFEHDAALNSLKFT
jgi:hypothetical protein